MRNIWLTLLLSLSSIAICCAEPSIEAPTDCTNCGMNRTKYGQSRMVIIYADGSSAGTCSLNCIVVDLKANTGKKITAIRVADYNTKKLIDAKIAIWVIGGKKKGVMTPVAKWAFTSRKAAAAFIKENGGRLATFEKVRATTEKELSGNSSSP